jgi:D-arabinitol dehydrogenase (NADP+)
MRAIVYDRPRHWELAEVPLPEPGPGQVRLRVLASGVCGTDVHLDAGEFGPVYPLTPGHEIVGVVDALGDGVTGRTVGETVALDNMVACGTCAQCLRARPQFCRDMRALGVTDPGGFADAVLAPAGKCHPAGDLPLETALLAEPTACVVHGLDVLAMRPGSDVLVLGTGPTGLLLTQLLRASGAARVTVAGRTPVKLELAAALGADGTLRLDAADPDGTARALRTPAPDGYDVVVDATGAPAVLAAALPLLGIGGTLFVYGMTEEDATLAVNPYDVFRRELTIKGSFSQGHSFDRAMALLRTGRVRADGIVSHWLDLDRYGEALDRVSDPACVKAVVRAA